MTHIEHRDKSRCICINSRKNNENGSNNSFNCNYRIRGTAVELSFHLAEYRLRSIQCWNWPLVRLPFTF